MHIRSLILYVLASAATATGHAVAQASIPGKSDAKIVTFELSEGSWMSLDISPDGKTLMFDLLNDIYKMPASGGPAVAVHQGSATQRSPQFSPDGQFIVYLSDESGADNVWISRADGSDARQITHETHAMVAGPAWSPDGESIAAVLTYSDIFRVRNSEIHLYSLDGTSDTVIVPPSESGKDVQEPRFAPNGIDLYFTERISGDHYVYMNTGAKNFAINRIDLERAYSAGNKRRAGNKSSQDRHPARHSDRRNQKRRVISGFGGATTPQISPDGKSIAFIRRLGAKTVLFVKNLGTGEERPIYQNLGRDLHGDYLPQEHYYPAFDWFPDNRNIAIWAKGKLVRIDTQTADATNIPFRLTARHEIRPAIRIRQDLAPEQVDVRTIRQLAPAPSGDVMLFRALGKLWQVNMDSHSPPVRLTKADSSESEPAWSSDGQKIAYVSWQDETGSRLIVRDAATGAEKILVESLSVIREPRFSNSGDQIVYRIMDPDPSLNAAGPETGLYIVDTAGGTAQYLSPASGIAGFSADDRRIFHFAEPQFRKRRASVLISIQVDGSDLQAHAIAETADIRNLVLSPDGKWLGFKYHNRPYVMPFKMNDAPIVLSPEDNSDIRLLSEIGGYEMSWATDSSRLYWTLGSDIHSVSPEASDAREDVFTVSLQTPADKPEGVVAFVGGKIVPIVGEVIEDGTVIVEGNRIAAVGPRRKIKVPKHATRIDTRGKTLMPGLFDAHGHIDCCFRAGTMPQQQPTRYAALAYGVTTNFDPYSNDLMSYESSEMTQAGLLVGPRWLKSGQVVHGLEARTDGVYHPLSSLEDARNVLKRREALGPSILKSYKLSTRAQRQRLLQAAREYGYMVDGEGAGQFYTNIGMILDGHTNLEHNLPVATYYDDLQQLIAAADTSLTPTLIVVFGELFGENFIYENERPWTDEKAQTFIPDVNNAYNPIAGPGGASLQTRGMHSIHVADEIYDIGFRSVGRSVTKLDKAGVTVNVGSHGQASGLAMHWEMLLMAEGGMAPMDILRAATLNGAKTYGLDHQMGSIEPGKLADLIVLDEDPTEDIRNTNSVRYTMVNGRLYDAYTMNEIGNYDRPRHKFYWEMLPTNGIDWKSTWSGE
ncbi:MAG: amidohydrolase family protein [Hyphomonas sp.]|jgi:Tol biopolymer transport system component|uniref:amidohydrolase family protein n=1 Tax=Hyphomonas sp. TaxID=87 RepID=UPI003266E90B